MQLDHRQRVAIGKYARGVGTFLLTVSAEGVITLTPAELVPLAQPAPARRPTARPKKKAASAAAEPSREQR